MSDATAADFQHYEALYRNEPRAYRRKVVSYIALGYGYVVLSVLIIAAFVVGSVLLFATGTLSLLWADNFLKAGIPLVLIAGLMLRAIFVRLPTPDGTYLDGDLRRKVLDAFDNVRSASGGQQVDEVVLDPALNAAVQQIPRYGLFGPTKNYLILGVPLLRLLTIEEARAVVAHEFGHLSHGHGRLGSMVYRLNQTLASAACTLDEKARSGFKGMSFRFLRWFDERFSVLTFAMRRGQEYEADSVAANATRPEDLSSSLCKLNTLDESLGDYWTSVWKRCRELDANDTVQPFAGMTGEALLGGDGLDATEAVDVALRRNTDFQDSHPCLRERLEALETEPVRCFRDTAFAIDAIFSPDEKARVLALVDDNWRNASRQPWAQSHAEYRAAEEEMASLREQDDSLEPEQLFHLACLEESLEGADVATPRFRALLERAPDNAVVQFHWGRINAEKDFAVAESALLRSADLDLELFPDIAPLLAAGYRRHGGDTSRFDELGAQFRDKAEQAEKEREAITVDDEIDAVSLDPERAAALGAFLRKHYPEIRHMYAAQKRFEHFTGDNAVFVAFVINYYHDNVERNEQDWLQRALRDVAREFPELQSSFSAVLPKNSPWLERLGTVPGALVYRGVESFGRRLWNRIRFAFSIFLLLVFAAAVVMLIYEAITGSS